MSKNISDDPFEDDTAIMLGNEGSGINNKQIASCDFLVPSLVRVFLG